MLQVPTLVASGPKGTGTGETTSSINKIPAIEHPGFRVRPSSEDPRTHPQPESVAMSTTQSRCSRASSLPQKSRQNVCVPWPPCMCWCGCWCGRAPEPLTALADCRSPRLTFTSPLTRMERSTVIALKTNIPSSLHPAYLHRDSRLKQPASERLWGKNNQAILATMRHRDLTRDNFHLQ